MKRPEEVHQYGPGVPDPTRPLADEETPVPGASEYVPPPARRGAAPTQPRGRSSTHAEEGAEFGGEEAQQVPDRRTVRGGYVGRPAE